MPNGAPSARVGRPESADGKDSENYWNWTRWGSGRSPARLCPLALMTASDDQVLAAARGRLFSLGTPEASP